MPIPTVRTIRQPPTHVPSVSDVAASMVTQSGAVVPVWCCVATSINTITPVALAASNPSATIAAPTSPPTSAWVELDGKPRHHEYTFQTSAPLTPAPTTATT